MAKKPTKPKRRKIAAVGTDRLELAKQFHQSGELEEARQAYQRVLQTDPFHIEALYLCGVVSGQLGDRDRAISMLKKVVVIEPTHIQAISELAKLFRETGQLEASADALRQMVSIRPEMGAIHGNLGLVLRHLNQPEDALAAYQKAAKLSPGNPDFPIAIGDILKQQGDFGGAEQAFRKALQLAPNSSDANRKLVAVLRQSQRHDEARQALAQWQSHEPGNPVIEHILAAYQGESVPDRASDAYVREVFNEFAESFEHDLAALGYRGPQVIQQLIEDGPAIDLLGGQVLDGGCGTGLCAPFLKPLASRLIGVDLSGAMLQKAEQLQLYDELVEVELTKFLTQNPGTFSLIVVADTLIYFGDLSAVLQAAANALLPGAHLIFSLEEDHSPDRERGYRLNASGRYTHNQDYVTGCIVQSGLKVISMTTDILRIEKGEPAMGLFVVAEKPATDS